MPQRRTLTLTIALDWPANASQGAVFTDAVFAEFAATKEPRFAHPTPGLGVTIYSNTVAGNSVIPRIWRRLVKYMHHAKALSPASDPWCFKAQVIEIGRHETPRVVLELLEG